VVRRRVAATARGSRRAPACRHASVRWRWKGGEGREAPARRLGSPRAGAAAGHGTMACQPLHPAAGAGRPTRPAWPRRASPSWARGSLEHERPWSAPPPANTVGSQATRRGRGLGAAGPVGAHCTVPAQRPEVRPRLGTRWAARRAPPAEERDEDAVGEGRTASAGPAGRKRARHREAEGHRGGAMVVERGGREREERQGGGETRPPAPAGVRNKVHEPSIIPSAGREPRATTSKSRSKSRAQGRGTHGQTIQAPAESRGPCQHNCSKSKQSKGPGVRPQRAQGSAHLFQPSCTTCRCSTGPGQGGAIPPSGVAAGSGRTWERAS